MNAEKRWLAGLAAGFALLGSGWAHAAGVTDSLTVTIIPDASYSLSVTTTNVGLDLGTVGLTLSTQTVRPSTITVTSSYAGTDLKLQGSMSSPGVPWTFSANTAVPAADALASWAVFTDTSVTVAPAQAGGFFSGTVPGASGSDVIDGTNRDVGVVAGVNPRFVALAAEAGYKSMESIPSNAVDLAASRSHLWLYFTLPPSTTDTTAKRITMTLTAGAPN
ncbi:MAG: hypothetical protein NDJ72_00635 [Elusimicrobia bacterium]|nr:hypothetical protein [Elusimicrobiota bacterium]